MIPSQERKPDWADYHCESDQPKWWGCLLSPQHGVPYGLKLKLLKALETTEGIDRVIEIGSAVNTLGKKILIWT